MQPSMVSLTEEHVQKQMHALHNYDEDLMLMLPPLDDFEEAEKVKFELSSIMVSAQDRLLMTVPALPWVMDHLPKYKAARPLGDQYEHYVHMLPDYVRELIFNALNGNLSLPMVCVWWSALMLAVDKGWLHKEGPFEGQKALRPVVIGMALQRIAERVPVAQL